MRTKNAFVRYQASDAGVAAGTETQVNEESAVIVVPVTFNAKYKKDKDGKTVTTVVEVEGKKVEQKVVEVAAKTVKANMSGLKFSDLTPDILVSLFNDRVESLAKSYVKGEDETSLKDGAEFHYTITPADLLGERVEISDELFEKASTAFMQYLATQGKTEKAQKNNALLLNASITKLSTMDQRITEAYENNLSKFVETSTPDLLMEIEPVITRANRRLERAKNNDIGNLI